MNMRCLVTVVLGSLVLVSNAQSARANPQLQPVKAGEFPEQPCRAEIQLVSRFLAHPDSERRFEGIRLAIALDVPGESIEPYLRAIASDSSYWPNPYMALTAMADLGVLAREDLVFLDMAEVPESYASMAEATRAHLNFRLGLEGPGQLEAMLDNVSGMTPCDAWAAIRLVTRLGGEATDTAPQLERLLDDPELSPHVHAALCCLGIDADDHLGILIDSALHGDPSSIRYAAIDALGICGSGPRVIEAIDAVLLDPDPSIVTAGFRTILELGPSAQSLAPSIIAAIRRRAILGRDIDHALALLAMGESIVPYMQSLLEDDDPWVRATANYVLYEYGVDPMDRISALARIPISDSSIGIPTTDLMELIGSPAIPTLIADLQNADTPRESCTLVKLVRLSHLIPDDMLGPICLVSLDMNRRGLERELAIAIIGGHLENVTSIRILELALSDPWPGTQLQASEALAEAVRQGYADRLSLSMSRIDDIMEMDRSCWSPDFLEPFESNMQLIIEAVGSK